MVWNTQTSLLRGIDSYDHDDEDRGDDGDDGDDGDGDGKPNHRCEDRPKQLCEVVDVRHQCRNVTTHACETK